MLTRYSKKGLPSLKAGICIRTSNKVLRIFLSVMIVTYFVSGVSAGAIETTKASALVIEEASVDRSLSFTKRNPHSAQADPCLPLLHASRLSPGASAESRGQPLDVDKKAVPVALGLFLGVRVALGPKEVVKNRDRVQIGPEFRATNIGNDNYALAVAAYRSCKNNHVLGLRQK